MSVFVRANADLKKKRKTFTFIGDIENFTFLSKQDTKPNDETRMIHKTSDQHNEMRNDSKRKRANKESNAVCKWIIFMHFGLSGLAGAQNTHTQTQYELDGV